MNLKMMVLMAVSLFASIRGAANDPLLTMPNEVTLTSGRVLRNVSVVRWEVNRVVLKHAAGADPIAFTLFKIPSPAELPAIRAASMEAPKKTESDKAMAVPDGAGMVGYSGRVVITVDGAEVKVPAGIPIHIDELRTEKDAAGRTPPGISAMRTTTDAEGNFSFKLPKGQPFVIYASFLRPMGGKNGTEAYQWRIPSEKITDPGAVWLTEANARKAATQVAW